MKLQQLTIHNIASIEDALIDFEAQPLSDSEVFLITGQTGAGKSTILDAICLALYANTPRLDNTSMQGDTKDGEKAIRISDPRQLMRRNTAEAEVTLTFTGSNGVHYKAVWSVARARKKTDGTMQSKSWSLTNTDSGVTLNKDQEIKQEIQAAVGLDFNQFCRTTLLAQGEFTRFLNSKDDEKAAILEKITGVDIYAKVGRKVYEVTAGKRQQWEDAQRLIEGIVTLTDEQLAAKNDELAALDGRYNELRQTGELLRTTRTAIQDEANQQKQLAALTQEYGTLQEKYRQSETMHNEAETRCAQQDTELKQLEEQLAAMQMTDLRKQRDDAMELQAAIDKALLCLQTLVAEKERRRRTAEEISHRAAQTAALQQQSTALDAPVHDAQVRMNTAGELLDKQKDTVHKFASAWRQKLRVGDICPVCRQQVRTALPHEDELKRLVDGLQQAYDEAERTYRTLLERKNRLEAEIKSATETNRIAQLRYDNDHSVEQAEQNARMSISKCGLTVQDETTAAQLHALGAQQKERLLALEQTIRQGEEKDKQIRTQRTALEQLRQKAKQLSDACGQIRLAITGLDTRTQMAITQQKKDVELISTGKRQLDALLQTDTPMTLDNLTALIRTNEQTSAEVAERKGAIQQELKTDLSNKQHLGQLLRDAESKKSEFQKWSRLNQLIGDATGNTFRRIAQSYVLNSLIHSANTYMSTLTDRYTLKVVPGTFVISLEDAYQGYVTRAASTISGGESFLVSLSLALALSDIGQQLAVDTLFIDEGFGTLSGEPLQNAVNTLRSLHNKSGRHVGIISHIEELGERIPVQIRVEQNPQSSSSTIHVVPD